MTQLDANVLASCIETPPTNPNTPLCTSLFKPTSYHKDVTAYTLDIVQSIMYFVVRINHFVMYFVYYGLTDQ